MIYIETLNEYLSANNIEIKNNYFKSFKSYEEKDILNQINLINEVDRILTRYSSIGYTRLYSTIGKRIENYKVYLRRLKIDLEYRESIENLNEVDLFLLNEGENILKQGWESIKLLKDVDYIELIKRSMNLGEICLGKTDESNLRKNKAIEIGKTKNISYNIIEEDIYIYLKKLKRRNKNLKIEYYLDEFINLSKLGKDSREYIKILLSFPTDTLKHWLRYKEGKKDMAFEEYLTNIKKAFEYER